VDSILHGRAGFEKAKESIVYNQEKCDAAKKMVEDPAADVLTTLQSEVFFASDRVAAREFIIYCPTADMLASFFTKRFMWRNSVYYTTHPTNLLLFPNALNCAVAKCDHRRTWQGKPPNDVYSPLKGRKRRWMITVVFGHCSTIPKK
jgi:hypothetical protein